MRRMARRGLEGLVVLLMAGLMGITVADVAGRYWLAAPLPGAFEITEHLLALMVFAALPLLAADPTTTAGDDKAKAVPAHVGVDLITSRLPDLWRSRLQQGAAGIGAAVLAVLAWRLGLIAGDLTAAGVESAYLRLPTGPVAAVMALCAALGASCLAGSAPLVSRFGKRP